MVSARLHHGLLLQKDTLVSVAEIWLLGRQWHRLRVLESAGRELPIWQQEEGRVLLNV